MTSPDSIEQLRADMAEDPNVRPILDARVYEAAHAFLVVAMTYARKWRRMPDPWEAERILVDARVWLEEATKRLDKEVANQMRKDERYKKGGVQLEP